MGEQTPQQPPGTSPRKPFGGLGAGPLVAIVIATVLIASFAGYAVFIRPASAQEVVYEEPDAPGSAPFTSPAVAPRPKTDFSGAAKAAKGNQTPFGGSGDIKVCDPEKLIAFLNANRPQKLAWTTVLGVRFQDFEKYVRSLTPVVLETDVRVTNHGFKNGKVFSLQSILAAGTAVLVDRDGNIVTKCYCGNPLTPPVKITHAKCHGCPPQYNPPPPCFGDSCYECPDEESCPAPDPENPPDPGCPPETCFEPEPQDTSAPEPQVTDDTGVFPNDNGSIGDNSTDGAVQNQ